jgi:hypothetical protein
MWAAGSVILARIPWHMGTFVRVRRRTCERFAMAVTPIVRYLVLCEDWKLDPSNNQRVMIIGLISNIRALDQPPYPLLYQELCVFLALTEGRGQGEGQIVCAFEESGQKIFETPKRPILFGPDPLEILGVAFRIRDCRFPCPGLYSVQFWYDGIKVKEQPLRMR